MTNRIARVSSMVNQPPCRNFAIDATKNMVCIARNTTRNTIDQTLLTLCQM